MTDKIFSAKNGLVANATFTANSTVISGNGVYVNSTAIYSNTLILGGGYGSPIGGSLTNTSFFALGNSTVYVTVNSTSFSGTSNNSINLGGLPANAYVNTTSISTLTANNSNYLGGQPASNFVNSSLLSANLSTYSSTLASSGLVYKASTLASGGGNGTPMTFNYAGQSGQPGWLWGTNDGSNIYVWNPSNFNVNYATSSGTASTFTSTSQNSQFNSIGVGVGPSGSTGDLRATGNITAYYSDDRLKVRLDNIKDALEKVRGLSGFYYKANEVAQSLGYDPTLVEVGVSAQEVQRVLPEIVTTAPISDEYLTVRYERLTPLIIEAIKDISKALDDLSIRVSKIESRE